MGLGLAIVVILLFGLFLGFLVVQARFAARHWRRVIAEGDQSALDELLDQTFDAWRASRPPRGIAPADWRALHTAALVAADRDRCRVSMLADADVRVIGGDRREVGTALEVARRAAVRMVERLIYEVPHVRFGEVQVDVYSQWRDAQDRSHHRCLLTTRATREQASEADWAEGNHLEILSEWRTRDLASGVEPDPEEQALITPAEVEAARAVEQAQRNGTGRDGPERDGAGRDAAEEARP